MLDAAEVKAIALGLGARACGIASIDRFVAGLGSIGAFPASGDKVSAQGLTAVLGISAAGCAGPVLRAAFAGLTATGLSVFAAVTAGADAPAPPWCNAT